MGTTIIEGCFDSSTNLITFEGEACDSGDYCGDIVRTGDADFALHPWMVRVVVVEVNCDDSYFGCFDTDTGKFKVVIPDDCCSICGCGYSGNGCPDCFDANETTTYLKVTFSGVRYCSDDSLLSINGETLCLPHYSGCGYNGTFEESPSLTLTITVYWCSVSDASVFISRVIDDPDCYDIELYFGVAEASCCQPSYNNTLESSDCNNCLTFGSVLGRVKGYDGSCSVASPCT